MPSIYDLTVKDIHGKSVKLSKYKGKASYASVAELASATLGNDRDGLRREFLNLVRKAETLAQRQPADGADSIDGGR